MKKWFTNNYLILIILIIATALRFKLLLVRGTFWFDEWFSFHFSTLPWKEAIKYWVIETNPPLYTLLLRFWIKLFGENELIVRLPSLILGIATIILLYLVAKKIFSKPVALFASFLFCFSGINIYMSTEIRAYSLLIFLTLLSFYLFCKIAWDKNTSKTLWFSYLIIEILLLYTHLTAILIPFFQLSLVLLDKTQDYNFKKKFFKVNLLSGLIFCIWFIPSVLTKLSSSLGQGWFFKNYASGEANILNSFVNLFVQGETLSFVSTILAVFLVCLFGWFIFKFENFQFDDRQKKIIIYLSIWLVIPIFIASSIGIYAAKYFAFTTPALFMLIGLVVNQITDKKIKIAIITILSAIILPATFSLVNQPIFDCRPITQHIIENETKNSITFVMPFQEEVMLKRYYNGIQPIIGLYPKKDSLSLDEKIVRFNWKTIDSNKEEFENWIKPIIQDKDIIFYVQYSQKLSPMSKWLGRQGWHMTNYTLADGYSDLYLFEFHAPNYHSTTSTTSTIKN